MHTLMKSSAPGNARSLFGLSPWLVVGVSAILALAVMALALQGSRREEAGVIQNFQNRGDALIWALEAGTRTWMGMQGDLELLQQLVVETAKQPDIMYIAVTDGEGIVHSHSDPARIGTTFPVELPAGWTDAEGSAWRFREVDGERVFEVWGLFAPIRGDHHAYSEYRRSHGHGGRHRRRGMPAAEAAPSPPVAASKSFVFVGLDRKPLGAALSEDANRNLLTALAVAGLGLAGFLSLFWAHSHRRARRMLMDARGLAADVVTSLPMGLIVSDPDGVVGMANAAAVALLAPPDGVIAGRKLSDLHGLDWARFMEETPRDGHGFEAEAELKREDGRRIPVQIGVSRVASEDGLFLGHLFLLRDVGEVKRLQAEVEKNRRLGALGTLAAGVAHEIRNPLSSIKGLATYLAQRAPAGGGEADAIAVMIGEVDRLNRVVSELLDFARPGSVALEPGDVNAVVAVALRLADADLRAKGIAVRFAPADGLPPVRVNAERLTQALLNLFLNAVQAMAEGGVLEVTVAGRPGGGIAVAVADNGSGMTEEVRAAVFTPYFTTKRSGTGLGLAIVHQIVEAHGGAVRAESVPGEGSVFTIDLPPGGAEGGA